MVRHPFPVSVGPSPFLELGWFLVTGWWPLLRLLVLDSSDARSHLHDALASASTPISGRWIVQAPAFLGLCLGFFLLASRVGCWLAVLAVSPYLSSLRSLAAVGYPGSLSGTCWLAIVELLFLWPPGFCGVPSLQFRSPVSGTVCVLPQSTIVAWLSLLWLGLLLVFVRFRCLRLTLWASA